MCLHTHHQGKDIMNADAIIPAYCITGAPGSGKGTQAQLIQERLHFLHVSSGDVFRHAIDRGVETALMARDMMMRGELVPDDLIEMMVHDELEVLLQKHQHVKGLILDGFPRTLEQADHINEVTAGLPLDFRGMISLDVPEDEVVGRLLKRATIEHRADDNEDTIRERLRVWRNKTRPIETHYEKTHSLFKVDGRGDTEEVYARLAPILLNGRENN